MGLQEKIMAEIMGMTDSQKAEVLEFARALRQRDDRETTALMEAIVMENEEAFRELAK